MRKPRPASRLAEQVEELGRGGRLKRLLAPQLAKLIVSQGDEKILESHGREIVVVFCDLRGYTAFTETAEPEEVLDFLREYHGALGAAGQPVRRHSRSVLRRWDHRVLQRSRRHPRPDGARCQDGGRVLGFGAGIAQGYATLGQIGFADRSGYTAIGTVCNLAARLCAEVKDGQILVAQRVAVAVEDTTPLKEVGGLTLKGLTQSVVAFNVPIVSRGNVVPIRSKGARTNSERHDALTQRQKLPCDDLFGAAIECRKRGNFPRSSTARLTPAERRLRSFSRFLLSRPVRPQAAP
jgi:class 3 adenylate cyclase